LAFLEHYWYGFFCEHKLSGTDQQLKTAESKEFFYGWSYSVLSAASTSMRKGLYSCIGNCNHDISIGGVIPNPLLEPPDPLSVPALHHTTPAAGVGYSALPALDYPVFSLVSQHRNNAALAIVDATRPFTGHLVG